MTDQNLKAFCTKCGQILISTTVPNQLFELASAPGDVLAQAVDATADMSDDKLRYLVPRFLSQPDDKAAADCVLDYQIELTQHLSRVLSSIGGGQENVIAAFAS